MERVKPPQTPVAPAEDRVGGAEQGQERGEAIVDHLLQTLDMERGGEIAQRLEGIYVFSKRLLLEARLERDADKIDLVRGYLTEQRAAGAPINPA